MRGDVGLPIDLPRVEVLVENAEARAIDIGLLCAGQARSGIAWSADKISEEQTLGEAQFLTAAEE